MKGIPFLWINHQLAPAFYNDIVDISILDDECFPERVDFKENLKSPRKYLRPRCYPNSTNSLRITSKQLYVRIANLPTCYLVRSTLFGVATVENKR